MAQLVFHSCKYYCIYKNIAHYLWRKQWKKKSFANLQILQELFTKKKRKKKTTTAYECLLL